MKAHLEDPGISPPLGSFATHLLHVFFGKGGGVGQVSLRGKGTSYNMSIP